jgi:integrase
MAKRARAQSRFWEELEKYPSHPATFILKILLLTGARKGEVLQATWESI